MSSRAALFSRRAAVIAFAGAASIATAGAATVHRLSVSQSTGSLGATTFLQNSSTSSALQGEVAGSPNTSIKIPFGVLGEYNAASSTTFGIGVAGVSTTGYGVGAEAFGASPAVIALGESDGDGVDGYSGPANGVVGSSQTGIGVVAMSGSAKSSNLGQTGSLPALAAYATSSGTDLFDGYVKVSNIYYTSFQISTPSVSTSAAVADANGVDVHTYGDIYVGGNVFTGCGVQTTTCAGQLSSEQKTSDGRVATSYSARAASPTMEDAGEAQLVNGFAHVSLDPVFSRSISTVKPYLVFTTPQGDSNVLYVTHRTPAGFDVRESKGGRSTMAFDYRIVADPYGARAQRMAYMKPQGARQPASAAVSRALSRYDHAPDFVTGRK